MAGETGAIGAIGDLAHVLPKEGLIELLYKAAASEPILALGFVVFMILALAAIIATVSISALRYQAFKDPEAAKTLRAMAQDEKIYRLRVKQMNAEYGQRRIESLVRKARKK